MKIRLSFGTAGIRAALGPGPDQINVATVSAVADALCAQLAASTPGAPGRGICVAFDGRTDSDLFAREVVRVALAHGFRVHAFETPVPTPLLAFCTRFYQAAAGVMITASHNPPHENGLKLYLEGGAQVTAPHDRELAARIAELELGALCPSSTDTEQVFEGLDERAVEAYLLAVERLVAPSALPLPRFAYTALCGVGSAVTRRVLARAGAHDVVEVSAQAEPRSDFGGLTAPNPEHPSALCELFALADRERVNLAFAHDPDADRLAVAERDADGVMRLLSGDQVGALLGGFMLESAPEPKRALLVSTLVSGDLLERIARVHGAQFERTPTGFKWIASRARARARAEDLDFVFGYEEAIGYAFGSMADDKDGIAALYVMLELVRRLHARGLTLRDRLAAYARQHGVFATRQITLPRAAAGTTGPDLLARLRATAPEALLGASARAIDHRNAPEAVDLLVLHGALGERVCVRPSGTEPKLKLYLHAHVSIASEAAAASPQTVERANRQAEQALDALESRLRAL